MPFIGLNLIWKYFFFILPWKLNLCSVLKREGFCSTYISRTIHASFTKLGTVINHHTKMCLLWVWIVSEIWHFNFLHENSAWAIVMYLVSFELFWVVQSVFLCNHWCIKMFQIVIVKVQSQPKCFYNVILREGFGFCSLTKLFWQIWLKHD